MAIEENEKKESREEGISQTTEDVKSEAKRRAESRSREEWVKTKLAGMGGKLRFEDGSIKMELDLDGGMSVKFSKKLFLGVRGGKPALADMIKSKTKFIKGSKLRDDLNALFDVLMARSSDKSGTEKRVREFYERSEFMEDEDPRRLLLSEFETTWDGVLREESDDFAEFKGGYAVFNLDCGKYGVQTFRAARHSKSTLMQSRICKELRRDWNGAELEEAMDRALSSYGLEFVEGTYEAEAFMGAFGEAAKSGVATPSMFAKSLKDLAKKAMRKAASLRLEGEFKEQGYESNFPVARMMRRSFKAITGPTNSGKTKEALDSLKEAESGCYLAPLRLLAMEAYDEMNASGVLCSLITGEETIIVQGAKHVASTIEAADFSTPVDVAIIDEFQMLADDQRGWAWTQAVVGVPAKKVFAIGSAEALPILRKLTTRLGDSLETASKERLSALSASEYAVKPRDAEAGDAFIAFSRKDVLRIAEELKRSGKRPAVIYGALSPEARRLQAKSFMSGESDVVVATDAIGMGVNLPIKRVIFSSIEKFDGKAVRMLRATEAKQIAGRAGRYGIHERGEYSAFHYEDLMDLRNLVDSDLSPNRGKAYVAPSLNHVESIGKALGTNRIDSILVHFSDKMKIECEVFKKADLDEKIRLGSLVENVLGGRAELETKHVCSCAPVSMDKTYQVGYFSDLLKALRDGETMTFGRLPSHLTENGGLDKAEELSARLTIYSWMSNKFPLSFLNHGVEEGRKKIAEAIMNKIKAGSFDDSFQSRRRFRR